MLEQSQFNKSSLFFFCIILTICNLPSNTSVFMWLETDKRNSSDGQPSGACWVCECWQAGGRVPCGDEWYLSYTQVPPRRMPHVPRRAPRLCAAAPHTSSPALCSVSARRLLLQKMSEE